MATILIVDDDRDCRRPLVTLLTHENYTIIEANNGLEGLEILKKQKIDLVLLDMIMPGVDGVAFLQAVRKNPRYNDLPVLLVTAQHDPRKLKMCCDLGIQEYMFKGDTPFARMLELIKKNLGEFHIPRRRGRKPKNRPVEPPPGILAGLMMKPQPKPMKRLEFVFSDDLDD
jgi:CheY-like chemotaxis protein